MMMRRIMPITWGVKEYKHRECVFFKQSESASNLKGEVILPRSCERRGGEKRV